MNLKLMTWNVENLFRPEKGAEDVYATKLAGLSKVINEHQPEVIALQEVGSAEALEDLIAKLSGTWKYQLSKLPDDRGIRVGFIAQTNLLDPQDILNLPEQLSPLQVDDERTMIKRVGRGILAVSVKVNNQTVRLVTVHLKSKLISYPGKRFQPRNEDERARYTTYALYRRAAEATTVRTYCNQYMDGQGQTRPVVLLGDMNDEPQAATTQILVGPGGSEIGSRGEQIKDKGDAYRLFNVEPLLPENERQTRVYRGRGEIVDHIFVSRACLEKIIEGSVRAPLADKLLSIVDNPNQRKPTDPSDHTPYLISLNI